MGANRGGRINEEVKRELSGIIRELKDPRIPMMTSVVSVEVTGDLRYAKAYVSVMGTDKEIEEALRGLSAAAGFIRREIGSRLKLRYTPEILFCRDTSIEYGAHINDVLKKIKD